MTLTVDINLPVTKPKGATANTVGRDRTLFTYVTIGSQKPGDGGLFQILPETWNCTRPAYGSVGSYHITTSREALKTAGLDIYQFVQEYSDKTGYGQVPVDIYMVADGETFHLFGGELDEVTIDYDTDTVNIIGRDWAGLLVDIHDPLAFTEVPGGNSPTGNASLTNGGTGCNVGRNASTGAASRSPFSFTGTQEINANDITPSQFARYIATHNGFNPEIYTFTGMQTIGEYVGGLKLSMEKPRTLWGSLLFFARLFGWVCYVTPDRSLYFGPIPDIASLPVSWGINTTDGEVANGLSISYNPRRNSNFLVVVRTFDTVAVAQSMVSLGVTTSGKIQQSIVQSFPSIKSQNNQVFYETQGAVDSHSLAALFEQLGKPVYTFGYDGKSPAWAMQHAYEKALEIAKRELITQFTIDGSGLAQPMQKIIMTGDLGDFGDQDFYAAGVEHSYSMTDGWYTHIHGWTLRYTNAVGTGTPLSNMNVTINGQVANVGTISKLGG